MTRLLWPQILDVPDFSDDIEVVTYDPSRPLPPEVADAEVFVVWGRPPGLLADDAALLTQVRLVQGFLAGSEALTGAGFGDDVLLSSGVGLHDVTVAEHTLAMLLGLVRRLPDLIDAQRENRWDSERAGYQPLHHDGPITTLLDAKVVIWGFGSIAAALAPLLTAFGATVRGVARSAGERHGFEVVTEDDLPTVLADCDVLISVLPGGENTRHALDATSLGYLPHHAFVVNVGRGSVLDEAALIDALEAGRLGGAALDVMQTEPLPADDPLWSAPNILLTPHCAGGRPVGYAELILQNLDAMSTGGDLRNQL